MSFASSKETVTLVTQSNYSKHMSGKLTKGAKLQCKTGKSIEDVLTNQLSIPKTIIEDKIKTIFLDGHPVDNPSEVYINAGSTLSLAAAMPGIAGICMGRNSPVAAFRAGISAAGSEEVKFEEDGIIQLKLFNTTIELLGPSVLKYGIIIKSQELAGMVEEKYDILKQEIQDSKMNGETAGLKKILKHLKTSDNDILLKIESN